MTDSLKLDKKFQEAEFPELGKSTGNFPLFDALLPES